MISTNIAPDTICGADICFDLFENKLNAYQEYVNTSISEIDEIRADIKRRGMGNVGHSVVRRANNNTGMDSKSRSIFYKKVENALKPYNYTINDFKRNPLYMCQFSPSYKNYFFNLHSKGDDFLWYNKKTNLNKLLKEYKTVNKEYVESIYRENPALRARNRIDTEDLHNAEGNLFLFCFRQTKC